MTYLDELDIIIDLSLIFFFLSLFRQVSQTFHCKLNAIWEKNNLPRSEGDEVGSSFFFWRDGLGMASSLGVVLMRSSMRCDALPVILTAKTDAARALSGMIARLARERGPGAKAEEEEEKNTIAHEYKSLLHQKECVHISHSIIIL